MLIVNWKKHYYVPTLFFNEPRMTSTRKGKFYFLSDFVFRIIHKLCFRYCLFFYVRYLFFYRFQKTCSHLNNLLFSPLFYVRQANYHKVLNLYSNYNVTTKQQMKEFLKKKNIFLVHFNSFFFQNIKNKQYMFFNKNKIYLNLFIKMNRDTFISYWKRLLFSMLKKHFIFKQPIDRFKSTNIVFLIYQIKKWRNRNKNYYFFLWSRKLFTTICINYLKNLNELIHSNRLTTWLKNKHSSYSIRYNNLVEKIKSKPFYFYFTKIKHLWKQNYLVYYNYVINKYHSIFYSLFNIKKRTSNNIMKHLNYVNLNNLIIKKEIYYKYKNLYFIFINKFKKFRHQYRTKFFKFLLKLFYSKHNWLLGSKHKKRFFKYLFLMFRKIKKMFKKLYLLNTPKTKRKKRRMGVFFNSVQIREHFFYFLGKKRYHEEFILLKNKKWYLTFYLRQYYNVHINIVKSLYLQWRKIYSIYRVKDLLLFLEYNVSIFINKYVLYNFSTTSLTDEKSYSNVYNELSLNFQPLQTTTFFIGDVIKIKDVSMTYRYYYQRFFIFFNFIYYINPFFYKEKFTFLRKMYSKVFKEIKTLFINNFMFSIEQTIYSNMNTTNYFENKNIINFLLSMNLNKEKYKTYIKTLLLLVNNSFYLKKNTDSDEKNSFFINEFNIKDFVWFYSFGKSVKSIELIPLTETRSNSSMVNLKQIRKPVRLFASVRGNNKYYKYNRRRLIKKLVNKKIYNTFYYKYIPTTTPSKKWLSCNKFYKKIDNNIYHTKLLSKMSFLKKDTIKSLKTNLFLQ